jgi:FMN phosphatase YigB (HAD superfamily)
VIIANGHVTLDSLISAFTSPIPSHIFTNFDKKRKKRRHHHGKEDESALEHLELKGAVFREFTIHIFQSISFLQNLDPINFEEVKSRMIDLPFKKLGAKKTIIFDLDETLAHCVR